MSEDGVEAEAAAVCCANCGRAEIDDVKLEECDGCDHARYCGDECQQNHRETHEAICKERAAELRDEILFRQPESSYLGDCPICFLPLSLDEKKSVLHTCCGKMICKGCAYVNAAREIEQRIKHKCPFCRRPEAKSTEESDTRLTDRAEANDPVALRDLGGRNYNKGDFDNALKYFTRAAELDNAKAHFDLADMYHQEQGVEKDEEREIYHLEEAAIAGHPNARFNLGVHELRNGRIDRAVKHFIIGANLGYDESLQALKEGYKLGHVSKDDLAAALRAHQAAVDATKSVQRDTADKFFRQAAAKHQS